MKRPGLTISIGSSTHAILVYKLYATPLSQKLVLWVFSQSRSRDAKSYKDVLITADKCRKDC